MNTTCLELRTKLEMEQCRLFDFAEVVGLLDFVEGQDLPEVLQPQKLVVIAVLTQIGCKLDEFSALTNRYKSLRADEDQRKVEEALKASVADSYVTLKQKWKENVRKSPKRKEHLRGTNHLFKWFDMTKDVATEPKRLWWAAFDEKVFRSLLQELIEYNNYLHEIMHGHHARRLEETSRKTFLEMVLVRSEIDDLRKLIVHSVLVQQHKQNDLTPRADHANIEHQRLLQSLVETKTRNINNEKSDDNKPPAYHEIVEATKLAYSTIDPVTKPKNLNVSKERVRTSGQYRPGNGSATEVWIEWKSYTKELDPRSRSEVASPDNVKRVKELVALLQSSSLSAFRVPHCLGYYDFRDDEKDSSHQALFGIVFQKPDQGAGSSDPISLLKLMDDHDTPSLSERTALAHKIADSVLYLNAVGWFHKGIRSDGIVFCPNSKTLVVELREPFMTGFEYARPDKSDAHSTHIPPDPKNEAYVHPDYQGTDARGTYRRSFDIYSLGIVLIEIAYWSPIHKVLANEFKDPTDPISAEVKEVRSRILSDETAYLSKLRGMVGDRYHAAVYSCIEGLVNDLDEKKTEVSLLLQKDFTEKVVENLGAVNV